MAAKLWVNAQLQYTLKLKLLSWDANFTIFRTVKERWMTIFWKMHEISFIRNTYVFLVLWMICNSCRVSNTFFCKTAGYTVPSNSENSILRHISCRCWPYFAHYFVSDSQYRGPVYTLRAAIALTQDAEGGGRGRIWGKKCFIHKAITLWNVYLYYADVLAVKFVPVTPII